MSTKIQINSLEALERLIGNDNELEIEIRNSIVAEFAKKHLKSLATTDLVSNAAAAVQNEIKEEFFETVKTSHWGSGTVIFKKEILNELKESLKAEARVILNQVVSEAIEETKTYETVQTRLSEASNWIINQLASEKLEAKLDRMVDARLKERLGLK